LGFSEAKTFRDLVFAKTPQQDIALDLYLPKQSNPNLIVFIHGGGWRAGNKKSCKVKSLVQHGYAVASISYRLVDKAIFPAQVHDCKAAVRWLRANGEQYGYQTEKIVVSGASAGGHLAALLGTSGGIHELEGTIGEHLSESSRIQGVIYFYGATDFVLRSKTQPHKTNEIGSVVYNFLGGGADQLVERAKLASAAHHVSQDDPPFLVFHGDKDKVVLIDQSQKIDEVYKKAMLPIKFITLKGAGHGGKRFYGDETREDILTFLSEVFNEAP
jgi:acetyl esterase/lipase